MSCWQSNITGYSFDDNNGPNYNHGYQHHGQQHPPGAYPPPPKAARIDYDQTCYGGPASSYQAQPTPLMDSGPPDYYSRAENQYSSYSQSGGGSSYPRQQQQWNEAEYYPPQPPAPYESNPFNNSRPSPLMATDPFAGFEESSGARSRGPFFRNSGHPSSYSRHSGYEMPPVPTSGFGQQSRFRHPPRGQIHGLRNNQPQPLMGGSGMSEPYGGRRGGGGRFDGRGRKRGPVSLLDTTIAPPSGSLPMQVKRERAITRWARAVRQEWPERERKGSEVLGKEDSSKVPTEAGALQVTSFLSEVLQREVRKNMTFLYGVLKDIAHEDRGPVGEFYEKGADETTTVVDLLYDDVFLAQGTGSQRFEGRENACRKALELFLRDKVYVVGCYRSWEGEQIPGFCVSNSRKSSGSLPPYPRNPKRERGYSDKPDSKTLPWLQVNPSSKMDTSSRLKPKSMKDFFILINGRGDDYNDSEAKNYDFTTGFPIKLNAVAVVNNSAQFNQMKVEYRTVSINQGNRQRCTIIMDKQELNSAEGVDPGHSRRLACEKLLADLSGKQPVVRMQLDRAVTVIPEELEGWAKKLAAKDLPWVKEMDTKLDPPNPMKEPHLQYIMDDAEAYLKEYVHENRQDPLKFGVEFSHDERMAIHKAARRLGLASKPYGPRWRLYQVISQRFSLLELKQILIEKGIAGRYALVHRGTADMACLWEEEKSEEKNNENGDECQKDETDGTDMNADE